MFQAPMGRFQLESKLKLPLCSDITDVNPSRIFVNTLISLAGLVGCRDVSSVAHSGLLTFGVQSLFMSTFLIRSATSESSRYIIVLSRLGGPYSRPNEHLQFLKCRESNLEP